MHDLQLGFLLIILAHVMDNGNYKTSSHKAQIFISLFGIFCCLMGLYEIIFLNN